MDVGGEIALCTMASISLTPAGCPRIQLVSHTKDPETPSDHTGGGLSPTRLPLTPTLETPGSCF